MTSGSPYSARGSKPRRLLPGSLALLALLPLLATSCAEMDQAGEKVYHNIFEKSRQRRIEKDTANLRAGRPLQYYRSPAHLAHARRTGRD